MDPSTILIYIVVIVVYIFLLSVLGLLDAVLPPQAKTHLSHFRQLFSEQEKTELLSFPDTKMPCKSVFTELLGLPPTCRRNFGPRGNQRPCSYAHLDDSPEMSLVRMLRFLSVAKKIDLCIFRFTLEQVADFLINLKRKQVKIRIIVDSGREYNENSQADKLRSAGVAVREEAQNMRIEERLRPLMHNKYVIIDDKMCLLGSFNWTLKAVRYNHETIIKNCEATLVDPLRKEFDEMWQSLA